MTLKNVFVFLTAFALQVVLIFKASFYFGKIVNPILFFSVSMLIAIYVLYSIKNNNDFKTQEGALSQAWLYGFIGLVTVVCSFEELRKLFLVYPLPTPSSDVLQQLEVQYDRFAHGIFPYSPVLEIAHKPYPVYMPMHWIPIGLSRFFSIDIRWSGFIIYAIATFIFGYFIGKQKSHFLLKLLFASLPSLVIWIFIFMGEGDLFITLEILIAAYYLILATGLLMRNNYLIAIGIILCLLSRYTFVFWLPLFGILFMVNNSFKTSLSMLASILGIVFLAYVYPFLLKDTHILSTGISYHNGCAVGEWNGVFWTSSHGIHFAYLIKSIIGDDNVKGVYINRIIQAIALLSTLVIGLFVFFKSKVKYNYYDFLLAFLYIFMLVFYCFSPLTYRYYLVVLLILSIAMAASSCNQKPKPG